MKKNVASQKVGAQLVSATDGTAFTGSVTVSVTGDAGTQATGSVGSGACTHEGNGYHTYAPAQAETNYDLVAFTFTGTGAIPVTVQIYTSFPQTGDGYAISSSGTHGNAALKTLVDTVDAVVDAVKAKTDNLPSDPADASVVAGLIAAVETKVDTLDTVADAIKVTTDKLDDTLEDQGGGTYGFTEPSLQEAPGGVGGSGDWDADEKTAIKAILGIPASGTTPDDPTTGILDTIRDSVATRSSQASVDDLPTNAELATALGTADDATLAAIASLNNVSAAQVVASVGTALATYKAIAADTAYNITTINGTLETTIETP